MSSHVPAPEDRRLQSLARDFRYPPTPDLAVSFARRLAGARPRRIRRGFAWAAAALALGLAIAFSVPTVRAGLLDFFQIGAVRVLPTAPPTGPAGGPATATPAPEIPGLFDLAGETTLAAARAATGFRILLPAYPAGLGDPDRVYLQSDGPMVILVWLKPDDERQIMLSLHEIAPGAMTLFKSQPRVIQETQVNGEYALWTEGPHLLVTRNGDHDFRRLVQGNTLIWTADGITYRLETSLTLEEALKIAVSLR